MGSKGKSKYVGKFEIGEKYGRWTVVSDELLVIHEAKIKCKCECGNEANVSAHALMVEKSTQCSTCGNDLKGSKNGQWKGYKEIPYSWFSKYFERGNKHRTGNITIEDVYNLWISQDKKCNLSGMSIDFKRRKNSGVSASIDRIDSLKEYTIDNIQLVHKDVNLMKNHFNQDYFITMCKRIVGAI